MDKSLPSGPFRAGSFWRQRRWRVGLSIAGLLLVLYVGALAWTTQRLETDIQKSIHALPDAGANQHDAHS